MHPGPAYGFMGYDRIITAQRTASCCVTNADTHSRVDGKKPEANTKEGVCIRKQCVVILVYWCGYIGRR